MKKVVITLVAIAVVVVIALALLNARNRKLSPPGAAAISHGGLEVKVSYSRPSKRGRLIFGDKQAGAVVRHGEYWRLGANEATEITFGKKVGFAGKPVDAGSYRIYAVTGPSTWKLILNRELGKWGAFKPDATKDVMSVDVPVSTAAAPVEQFTIGLAGDGPGVRMDIAWDSTAVRVPIAPL